MGTRENDSGALKIAVGIAGLIGVAGYAVAGVLQTLVWNPLAAVPGATLDEIHTGLSQANESMYPPVVLTWAAIGTALAAGVLLATARRSSRRTSTVLMLYLALLVLAAPSHWYASFSAGMALADAFGISGGDHAPWGKLLYVVSAAAFLALAAVFLIQKRRPSRYTGAS